MYIDRSAFSPTTSVYSPVFYLCAHCVEIANSHSYDEALRLCSLLGNSARCVHPTRPGGLASS